MLYTEDTEKEIIRDILKGNITLFEKIILKYQKLVLSIVIRFIDNIYDRDDVCQEIFIKVYQNLKGFEFNSKLSTWIGKVAYNHCINFVNKNSRFKNLDSIDGLSSKSIDISHEVFIQSINTKLEGDFEKKETHSLVTAVIDQLPKLYQTILNLFHTQELSYQEISDILSLPEGTVKSYLFRSRKLLKEKLLSSYKEEEFI